MSVNCAAFIMAWEYGFEGGDAIGVSSLNTTEESRVPSNIIAVSYNAGVVASGVAVPDIDVDIWDGLAGGNVDVLNFEVKGDTGLAFSNILANEFSSNVVWTIGILRGEDAGGIGAEDG